MPHALCIWWIGPHLFHKFHNWVLSDVRRCKAELCLASTTDNRMIIGTSVVDLRGYWELRVFGSWSSRRRTMDTTLGCFPFDLSVWYWLLSHFLFSRFCKALSQHIKLLWGGRHLIEEQSRIEREFGRENTLDNLNNLKVSFRIHRKDRTPQKGHRQRRWTHGISYRNTEKNGIFIICTVSLYQSRDFRLDVESRF